MAKPDYRNMKAPVQGRVTIELPIAGSVTFRQLSKADECLSIDLAREKMQMYGDAGEFPLVAQDPEGNPVQIDVGETFARANAALIRSIVPNSPDDMWQWEDFAIASVATPDEWDRMNEAVSMVNASPKVKAAPATQ
jgi:hypothetical protein